MTANIVFVDFGAGRQSADARSGARQDRGQAPADQAHVLSADARLAQASTDDLAARAQQLAHAGPALRDRADRLHAALAQLDQANRKLEDLSSRARSIAAAKV